MTTRRGFLRSGLVFLLSPNLKAFAEEKDYSYLDVYDSLIRQCLSEFKEYHKVAPEKNLIKAMIAVESGAPQHRQTAFRYDPMQIANQGDFALNVLANEEEYTGMIADFSVFKEIRNTPRVKGQWDYSQSNMTSELSIFGGVGWLYHKAARRGYVNDGLRVIGWRPWPEAVQRYNGKGNPNYSRKVLAVKKELDVRNI